MEASGPGKSKMGMNVVSPDKLTIPTRRRPVRKNPGLFCGTPEQQELAYNEWASYVRSQREANERGHLRALARAGLLDPEIAQYFNASESENL